jgi:hypothetical protein
VAEKEAEPEVFRRVVLTEQVKGKAGTLSIRIYAFSRTAPRKSGLRQQESAVEEVRRVGM